MRILLDSNVWLAILTADGQCRRMWRTTRTQAKIFVSPEILSEVEEKLRVKFGFSPRHAHLLAAFVRQQATSVEINNPPPSVCRDPDDDFILAAATAARCTHLVTGDGDLLVLKSFADGVIVTPAEFAKLLV